MINLTNLTNKDELKKFIFIQIVDKTTKISMNVLMFWSFFKKISLIAKVSVVLRDDYTSLSAIVFIF